MRYTVLAVIFLMGVVGCAREGSAPISPSIKELPQASLSRPQQLEDSHRLWMEYIFYFDKEHNNVEVAPRREGRFHLNALKFLEEYCTNCLQITGIKNNGDGTIDLTVKITHPFTGYPEYTGFDVKGIIMFDGSWEVEGVDYIPPWPDPFRVSWRKLGDPQVLNADGYSLRWSPSYDSGLPQPIYNYWPGKYSSGTPTANLNAYLDFYTDENRHMFTSYGQVERTYKIWLPPGQPVVAGYAVEACWELPLKTPVIDPASDFPPTANQPEAYRFYVNVNNGEPITDPECCGDICDPSQGYIFSKQWGGHTALHFAFFTEYYTQNGAIRVPCSHNWPGYDPCPGDWPEDWYCGKTINIGDNFPDGDYIGVAVNFRVDFGGPELETDFSYSVFEFTIDFN
jgi:hypothetical protein